MATDIIKSLARWTFEQQFDILILPENVSKAAKRTSIFNNPKSFLALFSEFMKRTDQYENEPDFIALWTSLAADENLINFISEIAFKVIACLDQESHYFR